MFKVLHTAILFLVPLTWAQAPEQPGYLALKRDMVAIHSMAELNNHLEELALRGQTRTNCIFLGSLRGQQPKQLLLNSHWQDYSKAFSLTRHPDRSVLLEFTYHDNARLLAAHLNPALVATLPPAEQQALQVAQQRVAELTTPQMSDYDKVRLIHDDLVHRAGYDLQADGSCATLLLTNRGVCETYSRTLWLLLRLADIPCHIVVGRTNEDHAWNLVQLNGEWYHVDATWDDPTIIGSDAPVLSHNYFLLSDAEMARDHSWVRGSLPVSAHKDALYFRTHARYFTNYGQMWRSVAAAIAAGETEYECYLTAFGDRPAFERSLNSAVQEFPGLTAIRTWSGPESGPGVIRLTFNHSGTPAKVTQEALELASSTVRQARNWWQEFDLQAWYDSIDLTPIRQEFNHLQQEASRQFDEACQQAEQKAAEWWETARQKVESWF
ncbi:MAG: hypothetical protein IJB33_01570 [Akkermansia sp.]|nr:hypothetical protein [Akkermansia sp.]